MMSQIRKLLFAHLLLVGGLLLASCTSQVRVEWSTETEINTAGFNLYRGESQSGPFDTKVNDALIPARGDSVSGGDYRFVDSSVRPGMTYYYRLEEIERGGQANTFGPVTATAAGLDPVQLLALLGLATAVVAIWVVGGRRNNRAR